MEKIESKVFLAFIAGATGEKVTATDWRNLRKSVPGGSDKEPATDAEVRHAVDDFAASLFDQYGYCCWHNWRSEGQHYHPVGDCPEHPVGTPDVWDDARIAFDFAIFDGGVHLRGDVQKGDVAVVNALTTEGVKTLVDKVRAEAKAAKAAKSPKSAK